MGEALQPPSVWGTSESDSIVLLQTAELIRADIYDSYDATLERYRQLQLELVEQFRDQPRYRGYDARGLLTVMDAKLPLLPAGIDRDGLLARSHVITELGIAKVDPETGKILHGSFLWPVAAVSGDRFKVVEPNFSDSQVSLLLEKLTELRTAGLHPTL